MFRVPVFQNVILHSILPHIRARVSFSLCSLRAFLLRFKNSCSGFSRIILVFVAAWSFVLEVARVPGQRFCVSFARAGAEIMGRHLTKQYAYIFLYTPPHKILFGNILSNRVTL